MTCILDCVRAGLGLIAIGICGPALAQMAPGGQGSGGLNDDFTRQLRTQRPEADIGRAGEIRTEPIWTFGVDTRLTVSDNIGLTPPGQARDGQILEISPYVRADVNRPRLQAQLTYALRNFYTSPDIGYEGPNQDLSALGNVALKDDWFWLAGQAQVHEVVTSPFGVTAADPSSRTTNRTRYSRYDISPYVQGQLGADTRYEAGYGFNSVKFGDRAASSTAHLVRGRLEKSAEMSHLGWLVRGDTSRREFDGGGEYDTTNALVAGLYRVNRTLQVGAGASYNRISVVADASGETSGWGPAVMLNWSPSPRTSLALEATHAYYGNAASARLSHRAMQWTFGLQYDQGITNGANAGLTSFDNRPPSRSGLSQDQANPVSDELADRGTLPGFGTPLASGLLGGALVEQRRLAATVGWVRLRDSVGVTVFASKSETRETTVPLPGATGGLSDLEQRGIMARYGHRLNARSTGTIEGRFTRSDGAQNTLSSDLKVFQATLSHEYSRTTTASIAYRRTEQQGSAEYRENAILAALNFRF